MSGRGPFSVVPGPVMGSNVARFRGCSWGGPVVVPGYNVGPWCNAGTGGRVSCGPSFLPSFLRSFFGPAVVPNVGALYFLRYKAQKKGARYWVPFLGFGVLWRRLNVVFQGLDLVTLYPICTAVFEAGITAAARQV